MTRWRGALRVDPADLIAGLIMIGVGLFFAVASGDLAMGSLARMGPGYFPRAVSILLLGLGAAVIVRGVLRSPEPIDWGGQVYLLFVTLALVTFILTIERLGLAVAVFATVVVARVPFVRSRPVETLAIAAGMAVGTAVLFVTVLGLPVKVLPV